MQVSASTDGLLRDDAEVEDHGVPAHAIQAIFVAPVMIDMRASDDLTDDRKHAGWENGQMVHRSRRGKVKQQQAPERSDDSLPDDIPHQREEQKAAQVQECESPQQLPHLHTEWMQSSSRVGDAVRILALLICNHMHHNCECAL